MIDVPVSVVLTAAVVFAALRYIHMLQLESYQGRMYLKWCFRHCREDLAPFLVAGGTAILLRVAYVLLSPANPGFARVVWYAADAVYFLQLVVLGVAHRKKGHKKPLVFTGRVVRLCIALAALVLCFTWGFFLLYDISSWGGYLAMTVLRYLPGLLLPLFLLLAYWLTYPIEETVKRWYYRDARKKLMAQQELVRVGITGSYGKTSTKFILGTILGQRYRTLVTPASFNTTMGVTRVIREQLTPEHQLFVAEMGARYPGDIRELCRLVRPQYGIITSVGEQHLETFKRLDKIIATKGELLHGLAPGGTALLNGDNPHCRAMAEHSPVPTLFFGIDGEDLFLRAVDIRAGGLGSQFVLETREWERVPCTAKLLGRHNILNITAAAALAYHMGMPLEEIAAGIALLEPVEHRLQLIPGQINVIDDAFNANPEGSRHALDVLSAFPGPRIVVTPGMVELGEKEAEHNRAFGAYMVGRADIVLLVGRAHVTPIREGLLEAGFPQEHIHQMDSLAAATAALPLYTQPGCTVLFENDLTDNYEE